MSHEAAENLIARGTGAEPSAADSFGVVHAPEFAGFLSPVSNTTFTPNQFFDVCLPHCSRSAIRLVGYFLRRTLGWCDQYGHPQEEQIEISFRELAAKSGVSRDRLRPALDEAVAGHFLECLREGRPNRAHKPSQSALYRLRWQDAAEYHKDPALFRGFFEREGNRTDIPNQYFDHIVPTEPLSVIKVVGSIIRSSIGFAARRGVRRQWAALSYSQIQRFTGLGSRKQLASALQTALARHYIVRLEAGNFTHEMAEQRSAVYALRWADGWFRNPNGQKSSPEETARERSEILTSHGQITEPEERSEILTSIKTKLTNEREKQQQAVAEAPASQLLRKEGFSDAAARELAEQVPLDTITRQIEWLPLRSPTRSRLGMLRRAMEQDWPEPPKLRTSEVFDHLDQARQLVRYFYAGYHANEGEPVAEPSKAECDLAVPLAERLLTAGAKAENLGDWGRKFGQMAREQRNPVASFQLALRQVGDRFYTEAEERLSKRRFLDQEMAKAEHRKKAMPRYLAYLGGLEQNLRANQPEDYVRFEADRTAERAQIERQSLAWRTTVLADFDSARIRLADLQRFFRLPGFWQWDRTLNPYPFNPTT